MNLFRITILKKLALIGLICIGSLIIIGCQPLLPEQLTSEIAGTASGEFVTPTQSIATPKPLSTAADTISSNPQPTVITLSFWTVDQFSLQGELVADQLAKFEAENPNIKVNTFQKKTSGQAGILNYLKSAQEVAPAILPDVIILPTDQLAQAWRNNLIQPIDGKLDRTIVEDLLPAALQLGTIDNRLTGIPYEIDVEHLVYNTNLITTTPLLWSDVLSKNITYQFPAKGQNGLLNDASIIQYLSTGGIFADEQGNATINEPALLAMLTFYQTAQEKGILDPGILNAGQTSEQWEQYTAGTVGLTHVSAHQYLQEYKFLQNSQPAPIPTQSGELITVGHGWAFAMVTKDATRQKYALKLIETFLSTEANTAWATQATVIPSRQTSFETIAGTDPYWAFLKSYLQTTTSPPAFFGYDQISRILQQAVVEVLTGEATPEQAVEAAVNVLKQQ